MKLRIIFSSLAFFLPFIPVLNATQADDTTITIVGQTAGVRPFISQLSLVASDATVIKNIQFTITPAPGSVTRPLSGTYAHDYLVDRGYLLDNGDIFLPIYGLYAGYTNSVTLIYSFVDGSSKQDNTTITTAAFDDQGCAYNTPTELVPRTENKTLSYDYIFDRSACGDFSPVIIDSDGVLRWVSPLPTVSALFASSTFFDGAAYVAQATSLYREDLDGTVALLADYHDLGVVGLHHNIDRGRTGLLIEPDTTSYFESTIYEVDPLNGAVIKVFNMADIISAAMIAGGDDPSHFVFPTPTDWFHNNGCTYNRADNSLIVSSRENFVVSLDYDTQEINWILGDTTKKWFQFPSLATLALNLASGSLPPIGQHAPSITFDQNLLVFDNGEMSLFQMPPGENRTYSSPRKYGIDVTANLATEIWDYPQNQSIFVPFCGSIYEDAPLNYLVDYALVNGTQPPFQYAQLLGLDADENQIFYYQYPITGCNTAYNSIPIHLENTKFPTVGPKALNLSTRGTVSNGNDTLIGGFIVTGNSEKTIAVRVLGPSLGGSGLTSTLPNPVLLLCNSTGTIIAANDDWATDTRAGELAADGLAPTDPLESATIQNLASGAYTVIARSEDGASGVGLVEVYDISGEVPARLANLSMRGMVGTGDEVLITGLIVGDVDSSSVILRALGPSLAAANVSNFLPDPNLTVYDQNGVILATNNNWQDSKNSLYVELNGLAPTDPVESAMVLNLPAGTYTAIVAGADGGTGISLVEIYDLGSNDDPLNSPTVRR